MELVNIAKFYENKTILVTGATGFLAKMYVEKILRIQPNVKKILILLRTMDTKSCAQRLQDEVLGKELFKVLRENWGENANSQILAKVIAVSGDISFENLGIKDCKLREEMFNDINIIINSAATTDFDDRYDVAMGINTLGAIHVLNFAKRCVKLQLLLHVSTAYVCGRGEGKILEKTLKLGESLNGTLGLNIDDEKKLMEETLNDLKIKEATQEVVYKTMKALGSQRAKKYGWPNTYVFTKAMGEMALGKLKENLPLVIVRPTMITSTIKEPFPGWIEGLKTIDSVTISYGKGKLKCFLGDLESVFDVIPGDMVVNAMIVSTVAHSNESNCHIIYHVGSSLRNPLRLKSLPKLSYKYFTQNPWVDPNGKEVKVLKLPMLSTMGGFKMYMGFRYLLILKVLNSVNVILQQKRITSLYTKSTSQINLAMRMADLYEPYLFFKGLFDDTNNENLRESLRSSVVEEEMFNFDPNSFIWEDYFMNIHFPGIIRYLRNKQVNKRG